MILTTINWSYPTTALQNTKGPHQKNMIQDIIYLKKKRKQTALDMIVCVNGKRWLVVTTESGIVELHRTRTTMSRKW